VSDADATVVGSSLGEVALAHDYLNQRGGAERVVLELCRMWPSSPLYTSLYRPGSTFSEFGAYDVRDSFLGRLPVDRSFRRLLPLYPSAFRSLGEIDADTVISSSSGWAHGVRTTSRAFHVVYCHTPARWLWTGDYSTGAWTQRALGPALSALRRWDCRAAARPNLYVANSRTIAERIRLAYGREAPVVHPPVDVERFEPSPRGERLLSLSRLLPYKRVDLSIEVSRRLGVGLDIVGTGPELERLRERAGPGVRFHGVVGDDGLRELLQGCRALCLPGREDFGISPVEAMAAGKPVIALGRGGALETVKDGLTGVHFAEQTVASMAEAVRRSDRLSTPPEQIALWARRYSAAAFRRRLLEVIAAARAQAVSV